MLFFVRILFISLVSSQYVQYPQSPCPGIFDYTEDGVQTSGKLTFHVIQPTKTVNLRVNYTIAAPLPSKYVGHLEFLGSELSNQGRRTISYRLHFPITSPLPGLTELVVNGDIICNGTGGKYDVTKISLQNSLFLKNDDALPISKFFLKPRPKIVNVTGTERPRRFSIYQSPSVVEECGAAYGNEMVSLIQRGNSVQRGDWPWVAAIYKRKDGSLSFVCSGTLVSDRHIVSAATCKQQGSSLTSTQEIVIKLGAYDLDDWSDDISVSRSIETAIIHDAFDLKTFLNNIVIFILKERVEFNNYIRPACLWTGNNTDLNSIVGATGMVIGWGKTEFSAGGHGEPRVVRMPIVSTATCRASRPEFHNLTSRTLCAGRRDGIGPCLGDSGAGLFILDGGRWKLRGVVSLSLRPDNGDNNNCDLNEYIVFTDIAKYMSWISDIFNSSLK